MGIDNAWVALTDRLLAMSVGEDAEDALPPLVNADGASPPPFISVGFDARQYYSLMAEAMNISDDQEMSEDMRDAVADVLVAAGDIYATMQMDVTFTSRGIEIHADLVLAD